MYVSNTELHMFLMFRAWEIIHSHFPVMACRKNSSDFYFVFEKYQLSSKNKNYFVWCFITNDLKLFSWPVAYEILWK